MMQKLNVRIVSFLLILVFSQKMGLEMWLHDWLHEAAHVHGLVSADKGKPGVQHQVVKCNCIDDSLMPLVESVLPEYGQPGDRLIAVIVSHCSSRLCGDKEFSSLRGPPAGIFSC